MAHDTAFWHDLNRRLLPLENAHDICLVTGEQLSSHLDTTVLVLSRAVADSQLYDVFVCRPSHLVQNAQIDLPDDFWVAQDVFELSAEHNPLSPLLKFSPEKLQILPLTLINHAPIGAICLCDPSDDTLQVALQSRAQLTPWFHHATITQTVQQQQTLFETINSITVSLTSTLSLEEIYHRVANPVRTHLNVEAVSIGLVDAVNNRVVFVRELFGSLIDDDVPALHVQIGQGIAGWVAQNDVTVITNAPYEDARFYRDVDATTGYETRSVLAVPLRHDGLVIGVLEALNKQAGDFTAADQQLVEAIANPLAIAIENANLHTTVLAEKRRIETIFATLSEGLLICDPAGAVTGINDAFISLVRLDNIPIGVNSVFDLIKTDNEDQLAQFIRQVIETPATADAPNIACNLRLDQWDNENEQIIAPVLMSGSAVRDQVGHVREIVLLFSDLKQVREVERMRDDFFSNIVHELRTPLATILMYARLLERSLADGESEKNVRGLHTIAQESDRLQAMVRSMLALARLNAQEIQRNKQRVDLNQIFDQIVPPLAQRSVAKGVQFRPTIAPDLPTVYGDRDVLYSIFKNLIENAVKFTLEGTVSVSADVVANHIMVEITDSGIGISAESMPSLFRRFFRSRTAVEQGIAGTGLGLYMVKEGIEQHNGTITVSSTLGQGTTFRVQLPTAD